MRIGVGEFDQLSAAKCCCVQLRERGIKLAAGGESIDGIIDRLLERAGVVINLVITACHPCEDVAEDPN